MSQKCCLVTSRAGLDFAGTQSLFSWLKKKKTKSPIEPERPRISSKAVKTSQNRTVETPSRELREIVGGSVFHGRSQWIISQLKTGGGGQ